MAAPTHEQKRDLFQSHFLLGKLEPGEIDNQTPSSAASATSDRRNNPHARSNTALPATAVIGRTRRKR